MSSVRRKARLKPRRHGRHWRDGANVVHIVKSWPFERANWRAMQPLVCGWRTSMKWVATTDAPTCLRCVVGSM